MVYFSFLLLRKKVVWVLLSLPEVSQYKPLTKKNCRTKSKPKYSLPIWKFFTAKNWKLLLCHVLFSKLIKLKLKHLNCLKHSNILMMYIAICSNILPFLCYSLFFHEFQSQKLDRLDVRREKASVWLSEMLCTTFP